MIVIDSTITSGVHITMNMDVEIFFSKKPEDFIIKLPKNCQFLSPLADT